MSWIQDDYETDLLLEGFDVDEVADIAAGGTVVITGTNHDLGTLFQGFNPFLIYAF